MTTTSAKKTPAPAAHGWRITWPMIVGWLMMLSLLWPVLGPYILGEKHFDTAAGTTILAAVVAVLTHSPWPTQGGGLPRPPEVPTTPAREARARSQTLRGEDPDVVDQEAPTRPGGGS